MDSTQLRIIILIVGLLLLAAIAFFGRPKKPDQGKRKAKGAPRERVEPRLGEGGEHDELADPASGLQSELELVEATLSGRERVELQRRVPERKVSAEEAGFDRIITLFVAAREGETVRGSDLVVAAEKAGLYFGDMGIFHRRTDGNSGPSIFSVASMVKPGSFDMSRINELRVPGLSFFMALPGPIPALDAWEAMLPTAQRLAELLDCNVLDEEHNALGRQRIAHIRDQLRGYDRKRESQGH
ncbi:MAG: cell division protein ZipA [Lysobacteraceae bacterium]